MSRPAMGRMEWVLLVVLSLLWGGSFFFAKLALAEIGPLTLTTARVGLAALALFVVIRARGIELPRDRATWGPSWSWGLSTMRSHLA